MTTTKTITMREVFNQLIKEIGYDDGKSTFEWYCANYNTTITSEAPASVKREVFGI